MIGSQSEVYYAHFYVVYIPCSRAICYKYCNFYTAVMQQWIDIIPTCEHTDLCSLSYLFKSVGAVIATKIVDMI